MFRTSSGLDNQIYFDDVELYGANKILITVEDTNGTTTTPYIHQVCDWASSVDVDNVTSEGCTGGGWRTLTPRKNPHTNTTDTSRTYEIYNGYFSTRASSPGAAITTPLSNFASSTNGRVVLRTYSTSTSMTEYRMDFAQVEVAIDPVYEPSGFATTSAGVTTGMIGDLVGASGYTTLTATDGVKLTVPMTAISTAADFYFSFTNIETYTGMNTILFVPEICTSVSGFSFTLRAWDFENSQWTTATSSVNATQCNTDVEFAFAFNDTTIPGFVFEDHISPTGEIRIGFLTSAPAAVRNLQFDRMYLMLGSVNADTAACEISWGTGTATDCDNTRDVLEAVTMTPTSPTWQTTAENEYLPDFYALDNDDDGVLGEQAYSGNISFPVTLASSTSVTAVHYAVKFRSASTSMTVDLQMKDYAGNSGLGGEETGSGWINTPGTDSNALTTYGYFDTWRLVEQQESPEDFVDTQNNLMNLRLRTSAGVVTAGTPATRDWDFAMMSVRWINEPQRVTYTSQYAATGGALVVGTASSTIGQTNTGSWRGTLGNDANYFAMFRTSSGLDNQIYFDDVELYGANKILITVEDTNGTTTTPYIHQVCDWASSVDVDNVTSEGCTGGGWRTLTPRKNPHTNTTDTSRTYEIYNGYFSTRASSPGAAITTPLSNFASSTNGRVVLRTYSTSTSMTEYRMDFAQVEVAIDPVYEPSGFATTSAGVTTGMIGDLVGASGYTTLTATDGVKLTVPMTAISTAADFYFSFTNIETYTGMNTILFVPEICTSVSGFSFTLRAWDFENSQWTTATSSVNATQCNTDVEFAFAFNDTTIPGFVFEDHISPTGEIRIGFLTSAPAAVRNLQFDRMYLMLGSVNADTAACEISWGTGTATDCDNTRDVLEAVTMTPTSPTWQTTAENEYLPDFYALDNDDDGVLGEQAYSGNISFPVTLASSTSVTAVHYAVKFRSASTSMTVDLQMKDYAGNSGLGGEETGSGWINTPGTDSNALTTYGYFDTWRLVEQQESPEDFVDTQNNLMNLRLRTSAGVVTAGTPATRDWDFAMMSVRYAEKPPADYISLDISDNTVGFGSLASSEARYATADMLGSTTETLAHTVSVSTNADGGYAMSVDGSTLTCIPCGGGVVVTPIGDTATISIPGTEQFGLRLAASSGSGITTAPYSSAQFAFATSSFPGQVASGAGDGISTTFDMYYLGNIENLTEAGEYSSVLTYTVTGTF